MSGPLLCPDRWREARAALARPGPGLGAPWALTGRAIARMVAAHVIARPVARASKETAR